MFAYFKVYQIWLTIWSANLVCEEYLQDAGLFRLYWALRAAHKQGVGMHFCTTLLRVYLGWCDSEREETFIFRKEKRVSEKVSLT